MNTTLNNEVKNEINNYDKGFIGNHFTLSEEAHLDDEFYKYLEPKSKLALPERTIFDVLKKTPKGREMLTKFDITKIKNKCNYLKRKYKRKGKN